MAGPTSGWLEIPVSMRETILQMGMAQRAMKQFADAAEKDMAAIMAMDHKLASATESAGKKIKEQIEARRKSSEDYKKSLAETIDLQHRLIAKVDETTAAHNREAAAARFPGFNPMAAGNNRLGMISQGDMEADIQRRLNEADAGRERQRARSGSVHARDIAMTDAQLTGYGDSMDRGLASIRSPDKEDPELVAIRARKDAFKEERRARADLNKDADEAAENAKKRIASEAEYSKIASTAKTGAIATEAEWHVQLIKTSQQIESNQKKMRELATSEVGSAKTRETAMNALAQQNIPLAARQKELNRLIENGTGGLKNNRQALQQLAFGIQDFISAGGMHNLAQGARGAANNLEMMAMSMGSTLSPLKLMGLTLLPTAALAAVEFASGMKRSADSTHKAADAMAKYEEFVKRTKDEVVDLTMKENDRELHRARREAGAAAGEGVVAEKAAWDAFRDIEHKMNVYSGKEQPTGVGDRLASGWFALKSVAARAANNAGSMLGDASGAMGGNRGAWWKLDTAHDQLADAELRVRGVRVKKEEGQKVAADKDQILGVRRDVRNEVDRRNKEIEAREENKHAIEGRRNDAIEGRRGRPLRKKDARDFDMQLKDADDEIKGLRDRLKNLERQSKDNPAMPLGELIDALKENTASNRGAAPPARLPNLGFGPMDALRGMGWNV